MTVTDQTRIAALCFVAFGLLAVAKAPGIFIDPRFWAEEGSRYFAACAASSAIRCMTFVSIDNWQLLTNVSALVATRLPLLYAPVATTFLALVMHLAVVWQISALGAVYRLPIASTVALAAAWAVFPGSYEVWMTSTNIMWVMGVSALFLVAMPTPWLEQNRKSVLLWSILCALSGPPGILGLAPFVVRAALERRGILMAIAASAIIAATLNLVIIGTVGASGARSLPQGWTGLLLPTILQTMIAPLASVDAAEAIGRGIRQFGLTAAAPALVAVGLAIIGVAGRSIVSVTGATIALCVMGGWIGTSLIQTVLGLESHQFISGWFGGRYFMYGSMAMLLCFAIGSKRYPLAVLPVMLAVVVGIAQSQSPWWRHIFLEGPSWRAQVQACAPGETCRVRIWPGVGQHAVDIKLPTR